MEAVQNLEACRICANFFVTNGQVSLLDLFEPTQQLKNEVAFIVAELKAWQLNISRNDGLPQRMCGNCFTKFCSIIAFREECLEAQQKLLQAFVEGDCAEEIVTAQDSALNGLIPNELEVGGEEIGLESMLVGGLTEETTTPYVSKVDEAVLEKKDDQLIDCNELLAQPAVVDGEEAKAASYENKINIAVNMDGRTSEIPTIEQIIPTTGTPLPFTNGTNETTIVQAAASDMKQEETVPMNEDLEELLIGNFIPKKMKKDDLPQERNNDDASDTSSIEDDSKQNPLACQYCYATQEQPIIFETAEELSQHFFDAHDPTFPYTCPECPQKFNNSRIRLMHVKQKHQSQYQQTQRMCQYCNKPLRGMTREEHLEQCQHLSDWDCTECGMKFKQVTHFTFKAHVQREHVPPKKQLKCSDCGRMFTQRMLWENHLALHAKNTVLWCNECKEAFADTYELKKHKYKMHNGQLPVNCEYCKKGFASFAFLNRHIQVIHPDKLDDVRNFEMTCSNCGTEFTSLHKLRSHKQRPLDENGRCLEGSQRKTVRSNTFTCTHCNRRFAAKVQLDVHIQTEHSSLVRTHRCEQCPIMCRTAAELKQHRNTVHNKPFACERCEKKFAYKKDLRNHMLCHEALEKGCTESGCGFICESDELLNAHLKHQHGLLRCKYCSETLRAHHFAAHMRNVHNIEDSVRDSLNDVAASRDVAAVQEKVVVEFMGGHANSEGSILQDQDPYTIIDGNSYSPFDDYAAELVIEQENEIVVT